MLVTNSELGLVDEKSLGIAFVLDEKMNKMLTHPFLWG